MKMGNLKNSHLIEGTIWLTIVLVGGTTYVGDVLIEYLRFEYYKNGSDYARGFL